MILPKTTKINATVLRKVSVGENEIVRAVYDPANSYKDQTERD